MGTRMLESLALSAKLSVTFLVGSVHSHINDLLLESEIDHSAEISLSWDIPLMWDVSPHINSL